MIAEYCSLFESVEVEYWHFHRNFINACRSELTVTRQCKSHKSLFAVTETGIGS
jgi:hypothetical protein